MNRDSMGTATRLSWLRMHDRRRFITWSVASTVFAACRSRNLAIASPHTKAIGFGFSIYGMRSLPIEDAIRSCAEIGYDCIELPMMADWSTAPEKLDTTARQKLRDSLTTHNLRLSALMENLPLLGEPIAHVGNLERLRSAGRLAHELCPSSPPVIETVLGGRPEAWEEVKGSMVNRLSDWARVAEETSTVVAIKAHVSNTAQRPEHVRWLLDQVASPWLKAAFDFSHFQLQGLDLKLAWDTLVDDIVFIHIKDSIGDAKKFRFVLPGDGATNYVQYLRMVQ